MEQTWLELFIEIGTRRIRIQTEWTFFVSHIAFAMAPLVDVDSLSTLVHHVHHCLCHFGVGRNFDVNQQFRPIVHSSAVSCSNGLSVCVCVFLSIFLFLALCRWENCCENHFQAFHFPNKKKIIHRCAMTLRSSRKWMKDASKWRRKLREKLCARSQAWSLHPLRK